MAYSEQTDWSRDDLRRRGLGLAIALLLEIIIILAILSLSMRAGGPAAGTRGLSTFSLEAASETSSSAEKSETQTPVAKTQKSTATPPIPKPLLPPVNPVQAPPPNPDFIKISKSDFDAMDLSKLPAGGGAGAGAGESKGSGQGAKGMMGPGLGPGGAQLYPVAWLREPYDSELTPYLAAVKRIPPGASADIACRMIERNRVENCQIIGENPRGTGLAKALRLAAWQFLVKPPRIDNKPQLGVWVRIHFNFGVRAVDGEGGGR
jgi:protein TonB